MLGSSPLTGNSFMALGSAPTAHVTQRNAVIRCAITAEATIATDVRCGARIDSELFAVAISVSVKVGA